MTNQEYYSDFKWIKVKRHQMDREKSWEECYKDLEQHHCVETNFLVEEVRRLAMRLDEVEKTYRVKELKGQVASNFLVMWFMAGVIIVLFMEMLIPKEVLEGWMLLIPLGVGAIISGFYTWSLYAAEKERIESNA